jgi:sigma-B regulation protein RsbU (phosphoserine phosphatase)
MDDSPWRKELAAVVSLMQDLSRQTDPQAAAVMYGTRLREAGLVPSDAYLAVSRRDLEPPAYRITRFTGWQEDINPWRQKDRLPVFARGLLGELIYSNEPQVIEDLPSRVGDDDPAREYLREFNFLVTMPQYDNGVALNMGVILVRDPSAFPRERIPVMVWQSNLWGRGVLNLVLKNQLREAYDILDEELRTVGDMQKSLLPETLPAIPTLDLAVHYETSRRAGGDYYDIFDLGNGKWGILIADVSGHSTPAAVIMAITHAVAHLHPGNGTPPGELLSFVNHHLAARYTMIPTTFVTAFYGVYDAKLRTLAYARAGHNPPRWRRGSTVAELDQVGGLPLGIAPEEAYDEATVQLAKGDSLFFYTDGITEARDTSTGRMFGTEPLDRALRTCDGGVREMLAEVLKELHAFTIGRAIQDDRTLLGAVVK